MIKIITTVSLLLAVASAFPNPQGPPGENPNGPAQQGPGGVLPRCLPPGPPGGAPPQGPPGPPPTGPDGAPLPPCSPTIVSGHCGGKTYYWDTAKESEPEEFKKCFYGDGPVSAMCSGKEYTWDPAKESKPKDLEICEKEYLARQNQQRA